jgi:hypothetical protein
MRLCYFLLIVLYMTIWSTTGDRDLSIRREFGGNEAIHSKHASSTSEEEKAESWDKIRYLVPIEREG